MNTLTTIWMSINQVMIHLESGLSHWKVDVLRVLVVPTNVGAICYCFADRRLCDPSESRGNQSLQGRSARKDEHLM